MADRSLSERKHPSGRVGLIRGPIPSHFHQAGETMKRKKQKSLVKQCRPQDKIVVTGPATLRLSRRAIVTVSARDKANVRIE